MTSNAEIEQRVAELRAKVALLREQTMKSQIALLVQKNGQLKKDIDNLKAKYETALLSNGKSVSLLTNAARSMETPASGAKDVGAKSEKSQVENEVKPQSEGCAQSDQQSPKKSKKEKLKGATQPKGKRCF